MRFFRKPNTEIPNFADCDTDIPIPNVPFIIAAEN